MTNTIGGGSVVRFGDFKLDLQSGELAHNGSRVLLPDQPFRLLAILIRQRGVLVTRDHLRRELWPEGTFVDFEPSLNAAVKRVREALGDSATAPRFIETLPKRGYRFIAPVYEVTEHAAEAPDAATSAALPASDEIETSARAREHHPGVRPESAERTDRIGRSKLRWIPLIVVIGTVVLVAIAAWGVRVRQPTTTARVNPGVERLTSDGTVRLAAMSFDGRDVAYIRREGVRESLWLKKADSANPTQLLEPVDGTFLSLTFAATEVLHYTLFRPNKTLVVPYRLSMRGGAPEELREPAGRTSFNRDGSRYAYISTFSLTLRESRIVVSDADGGNVRVIIVRRPPESFVRTKPAWSPDGSRLVAFGISENSPSSPELLVVDVASGRQLKAVRIELDTVDGAFWLPDGERVVVSGRQSSATPQRLWLFSLPSNTLRPLTSDLSDYAVVGVSASQEVVAVRGEVARSLWAAEVGGAAAPRQIAPNSGDLGELEGLAWASGEDILYTAAESGNVDIWTVNINDHTRRQLTSDPADDFHPSATADGRTVVFASNRAGSRGIWTMGRDGSHPKRLTVAADVRPSISRDGRVLVFQRGAVDTTPFTLWRLPIGGKEAVELSDNHSMRPAISPDGLSIAHYLMTAEAWMLAITPIAGGPPVRTLPISGTHAARVVRWSPDGRALAYIDGAGGASNIWVQPLDGSPARTLTSFTEGRITTFDWSRDGSRLAWTRVDEVRDVVTVNVNGEGRRH
jgi:Tol biopolymer transport system component/DNA-binding winged helix-turn-helix (wHTH) protein